MLKKRETCNKKCTGANNKGGKRKKKVYIEVEDNMQRKKRGVEDKRTIEICARSKSTNWVT
jgi:hypothetical protein